MIDNAVLLEQINDVIRTAPSMSKSIDLAWLGRAAALLGELNDTHAFTVQILLPQLQAGTHPALMSKAYGRLITLLHQAREELRLYTVGPMTTAFDVSQVYDYFDGLRKIVEEAKNDILFVDPYLDAEFVSRYLPHVTNGVSIRLLTNKKLDALLPSVRMYVRQHGSNVEVRSTPELHDRFVFIDKVECYQSGASFKDGARNAGTTITQITDAFAAMMKTYQDLWDGATTEFP